MFKPIIRIAAAALAAGAIAFAITVAPAAHDRAKNLHVATQATLLPYPKARSSSRPDQGGRMLVARLARLRAEVPI